MNKQISKAVDDAFRGKSLDVWMRLRNRVVGAISDFVPDEDVHAVVERIMYHSCAIDDIFFEEQERKIHSHPNEWERAKTWKR